MSFVETPSIMKMRREAELLQGAFSKESDRGVVLVASAFFDTTLERLLRARFSSRIGKATRLVEPLFGGLGPLSTFSAKIRLSYAIDLLQDWMAADLDLIRRIRNEFSHSFESASFASAAITQQVDQLQGYEMALKSINAGNNKGKFDPNKIQENIRSRWKFNLTCSRIGALLQAKAVIQESDAPDEAKHKFMTNPAL